MENDCLIIKSKYIIYDFKGVCSNYFTWWERLLQEAEVYKQKSLCQVWNFCEQLVWEVPEDPTPPQTQQVPVNLLGCPPGQDNKLLLNMSHTL